MFGFLKKLGKGLLKVAPIASAFIPGVGPLAAMAIGAGTSALSKKASGGSWKDALGAGLTSAATSALMPGLGKGLSPSKLPGAQNLGKLGLGGAKKGFLGTLGDIGKSTGKQILAGGGNLGNRRGLPDLVMNLAGSRDRGNESVLGRAQARGREGRPNYSGRMPGLAGVMGERNQNFPNLAESIGQGRLEAIRNQPWRGGYDAMTYGPADEEGNRPEIWNRMPPIYPNRQRRAY